MSKAWIAGLTGITLILGLFGAAVEASTVSVGSTLSGVVPLYETGSIVRHSMNLGPVNPAKRIPVTIDLRSRSAAGLKAYAQATANPHSPQYHHFLTRGELLAKFGPSPSAMKSVAGYLAGMGIVAHVQAGAGTVTGVATVRTVERAFGLTLNMYRHGRQTFMAPAGPVMLPRAIAADVVYIEGLSTYRPPVPQGLAGPGTVAKGQAASSSLKRWEWLRHFILGYTRIFHVTTLPFGQVRRSSSRVQTDSGAGNYSLEWWITPSTPFAAVGQAQNLTVQMVDQYGNPVGVAGLDVAVTQVQESFGSVTGQSSSAVVTIGPVSGNPGQSVSGTTDAAGQVTFSVADNANEEIALSASLVSATGGLYGSTGGMGLVWAAPDINITPSTTSSPTGQNIDLSMTVTDATGSGVPAIGMLPYTETSTGILPASQYSGGTAGYIAISNNAGTATGWIYTPDSFAGNIYAIGFSLGGSAWYYGATSGSVSWTGSQVVDTNQAPGQPAGTQTLGATPQQINSAYDAVTLTKQATDANAQIGIYAESSYTASDIATYFAGVGLPSPTITVVPVDGTASQVVYVPGWHAELELDLERAGSSAPGAQITVYTLALGNGSAVAMDPLDVLNAAVTQDTVSVMSFSMGMPEDALPASYAQAWDQALQEGTAEGITFVAASGDGGAFGDPFNPSVHTVSLPASDPLVTAVGGTQLGISSSTGARQSEQAWSPNGSWFGVKASSGGGYSSFFPAPSYQSGVNSQAGRGVPDLALMATWPWYMIYNSNYTFIGSSGFVEGWVPFGGTSASAPTWAGYVADMAAVQGRMGSLNPALYSLGVTNPAVYNDITVGNNGYYSAGTGWDPVTGLGSVNVDAFTSALGQYIAINSVAPSPAIAGETVVITGDGFGATQGSGYVQFQNNGISWGAPGNLATFTIDSWSNNRIVFTVPNPSGANGQWAVAPNTTATVSVTNSSGSVSNVSSLQIAAVAINQVNPASGGAGEQVTVTGDGFGTTQGTGFVSFHDNGVNWGAPGNAATFQIDSWNNTQVVFTIPTPSGPNGEWAVTPGTTATFTVTNSSSASSDVASLAITSGPVISGSTPSSVAAGDVLTINGSGFGGEQGSGFVSLSDGGINWGSPTNAAGFPILSWTDTQIQIQVPYASGSLGQWALVPGSTATLSLVNGSGEPSNVVSVAIAASPSISGVSPSSGSAGQQVTATGTGFGSTQGSGFLAFHDNGINWGTPGNAATFQIDSWSNTQVVFTIPTPSGPNGEWAVTPGTTAWFAVTTSAGEQTNPEQLGINP